MNKFILICILLGTFLGCKKNDFLIANWNYPSHLPRDKDLIGVWYNLIIYNNATDKDYHKPQGCDKIIFHDDGRYDNISYDTLKKDFVGFNAGKPGNVQLLYWSAENNQYTIYDVEISSGDNPNEPHKNVNTYYFSPTKDSLYITDYHPNSYVGDYSRPPDKVRKRPF